MKRTLSEAWIVKVERWSRSSNVEEVKLSGMVIDWTCKTKEKNPKNSLLDDKYG